MVQIAVLICTMNRPEDLRRALISLQASRAFVKEILVSDDSVADDSRSEAVCAEFECVKFMRGPRRGLAENRNACLEAVTSEFLHFIDDDVVVPPDFYSHAAAVIGNLQVKKLDRFLLTGVERKFDGHTGSVPTCVEPAYAGIWAHLRPSSDNARNCIVINATVFPTTVFRYIKFDAFFKYGYEESDITLQAMKIGYHLVYERDLYVDHFPSPLNRDVYKSWVVASQVYAGLKRQWVYSCSVAGTLLFTFVAVPRLLIHILRFNGFEDLCLSLPHILRGFREFARSRTILPVGNSDR